MIEERMDYFLYDDCNNFIFYLLRLASTFRIIFCYYKRYSQYGVQMNYKVLVDFRERHENSKDYNMEEALKRNNVPYELTHLEVGDYIVENLENGEKICIERKIIKDLVGSMYDGRLQKELQQMELNFTKNFIVVIGDWKEYNKEQGKAFAKGFKESFFTENQRLGLISSITCRYNNVKLIQIETDDQFCILLEKLIEKSVDGKLLGDLMLKRKKTNELTYFNILTGFPNIGSDKAEAIMKQYPSFIALQNALKYGSFKVSGIGEKTISSFSDIFIAKEQ